MKDQDKAKEELGEEIVYLRRRVSELEASLAACKQRDQALRERKQALDVILDSHHAVILIIDPDTGAIVDGSLGACDFYGYTREELTKKKIADINVLTRDEVFEKLQAAKSENQRYFDFQHRLANEELRDVEVCSGPIAIDGRTLLFSVITDVTDQKRAENELREKERLLEAILSTSPVGIGVTRDRRIMWRNEAWATIFGFENEAEYLGQSTRMLYPSEEEYERIREILYAPLRAGQTTETDLKFKRRDGTVFDAHMRMNLLDPSHPSRGTISAIIDITDRKKAEEAIRQSRELLKVVTDTIPAAMFYANSKQRFLFSNKTHKKWWAAPDNEDLAGRTLQEVFGEFYVDIQGHVDAVLSGQEVAYDRTIHYRDGAIRDVAVVYTPHFGPDGEVKGFVGLATDISERKRAEEALRGSEEKYRLLVEQAREGILVAQDGVIKFLNPRSAEVMGYSEDELRSKSFGEFIHPDDRDMVLQLHFRRLRGEELPNRYPVKILTRDGDLRWVEIDAALIQWAGKPAVQILITDITERRQAEKALKESEEWYRSLVEDSFDGIFVQKGPKIIFANSRLHKMLGYSAGELIGLDHWLIYHPDYQETLRERAMARMRGEKGLPHQYEVRLLRKDRSSLNGEVSARAVTVKDEPGVQVWVRDLSKRKRLEEVQRRLATAVEQAEETIVITDPSGSIQYVNPAFEKITGYTKEEALGKNPSILKSGNHEEEFYRDLWNSITNGKVWKGRFVNRRKNGTLYSEDATISPVRNRTGKIVNFVAVKRDVTEELAVQQRLLQAQKMEAIGTLAGGIAHDFNNLLQVTLGYSELLLSEKSRDNSEYADLQKIHHAARSGAELVQGLLTFSSKVESKPMPLDINRQVKGVEELLRRTIPRMIDIRLELAKGLKRVNADPARIEQVIMNLAVNARDAMGESGSLSISTGNATLDAEYCRLRPEAKPGDYVLLSVSDTGHGMDKDTLVHIFEPFFTTKKVGRGTGLGLAMVYGIVQQHGGHITCCSEVGKGTTFKVYFPAIEIQTKQYIEDSDVTPAFGDETLLLVDDEELVIGLGIRVLGKAGYQVLSARNGKEALDLYKKERTQISLVILDWIMPEMGGKDCLHELLKINPRVKVLIASGYTTEEATKEPAELGAKGFVAKPFRVKQLLRDVRKTLDEN